MKLGDNNISTIILAGGNSVRMEYLKSWLKKDNGISFLAEVVHSFTNF